MLKSNPRISAKGLQFTLLVTLSLCLLLGFAQADTIYQTGNDGTALYRTDSTNGLSTLVGFFGYSSVYGDAFSPSGQLFAMVDSYSPSTLARVNLSTGVATPVGAPTGIADLMGIAFAPNGTLYGVSWDTNSLYTLNTGTGAATLLGSLGMPGEVMDLSWDYRNGTMYAIASEGPAGSLLFKVNLTTGAGTRVTNIPGDDCLMGLINDTAGNFLATDWCSGNSPLYKIDPSTGNLTSLGLTGIGAPMGGDIRQTATPEPLTLLTFGTGVVGLFLRKKFAKKI
jgi:PEP-CTERM motif